MLSAFMIRHSLTQQQLAHGSGLPASTINGMVWGTRRPRADTVNRLLRFLKRYDGTVSYEDLFARLPDRADIPKEQPKARPRPRARARRRSLAAAKRLSLADVYADMRRRKPARKAAK